MLCCMREREAVVHHCKFSATVKLEALLAHKLQLLRVPTAGVMWQHVRGVRGAPPLCLTGPAGMATAKSRQCKGMPSRWLPA